MNLNRHINNLNYLEPIEEKRTMSEYGGSNFFIEIDGRDRIL